MADHSYEVYATFGKGYDCRYGEYGGRATWKEYCAATAREVWASELSHSLMASMIQWQ